MGSPTGRRCRTGLASTTCGTTVLGCWHPTCRGWRPRWFVPATRRSWSSSASTPGRTGGRPPQGCGRWRTRSSISAQICTGGTPTIRSRASSSIGTGRSCTRVATSSTITRSIRSSGTISDVSLNCRSKPRRSTGFSCTPCASQGSRSTSRVARTRGGSAQGLSSGWRNSQPRSRQRVICWRSRWTHNMEPLVALRGIAKSFPGVLANDRVDFDVDPGEVHALLGENGAGKTTLVKVLYGFHQADAGTIQFGGRLIQIRSPHDARRLGIGMVFQQFTLIPALTVVENVALFLPHLPAVLNHGVIAKRIEEESARYGLAVDPWAPVWRLSIGEQQKVEILKLLLARSRVLIFDEPTRVLVPHEIDGLFRVLANLREHEYAIVFITHKMPEVLVCADRITVLRRGVVAGTLMRGEATEQGLVGLMFGAALPEYDLRRREPIAESGRPLLELQAVDTGGDGVRLQGITVTIAPGEIVGVAGVSGNGQQELGDVILGLTPCIRGRKIIAGQDATRWPVDRIRRSGVAFIPEDPLRMLIVPRLSVLENMALADTRKYARHAGLTVDWSAARGDLEQSTRRLAQEMLPLAVPAGALSGGNVQRLSLIRELSTDPRLIIALYPTRGLDMRSATAARDLLLAKRDRGAGVLLISEDLGELFLLSDRLFVLYRGRIVGALFTTWGAAHFAALPAWALLPLVAALGFLGGGLWAAISGVMRAHGWVSETISTLLLNYVAIFIVSFFVFGPWKDLESANYPQTPEFPAAARLPMFFGTRVHLGLLIALVALTVYHLVLTRTRWRLEILAIGGNIEAARRSGIAIGRYILVLMFVGGGLAGLAGMGEVSAIQGRLRPSLSPGFGYTGFLISWIAGGNTYGIVASALLMAVITAGGDVLQMAHRLPGSVVNILMALMLFVVLTRRRMP